VRRYALRSLTQLWGGGGRGDQIFSLVPTAQKGVISAPTGQFVSLFIYALQAATIILDLLCMR